LDVGYSARRRKSIVPVYDDLGRVCVGVLERSEHPRCDACRKCHPAGACHRAEPKWWVTDSFPKGQYLYNYHAARRSDAPRIFLVEGPGDVFSLAGAGFLAVAALGSVLSDAQADKLVALGKEVVIAFDNDDPGREGAKAASESLRGRGF